MDDFCYDPLLILLQGFIATILNAYVIMNKEIMIIIIWISLLSQNLRNWRALCSSIVFLNLNCWKNAMLRVKQSFLFFTAAGGLARPNSWLVFAKVSTRFSSSRTLVRKYRSERLYRLQSIRHYLVPTR